MTTAQKTMELYNSLGILADCKRLSKEFNRESNQWEVWGHFQNENGRRNGRVAQFDSVEDAVDFVVLAGL